MSDRTSTEARERCLSFLRATNDARESVPSFEGETRGFSPRLRTSIPDGHPSSFRSGRAAKVSLFPARERTFKLGRGLSSRRPASGGDWKLEGGVPGKMGEGGGIKNDNVERAL